MAGVTGRSGRKLKPAERKLAAGNPGKRVINTDAPDFGLATDIDPPDWIVGQARDMWLRVAPLLLKQKVLQLTDLHNVEAFCIAYGNFRAAAEHVATHGTVMEGATGGPVKNPALTALNEATKQMSAFGSLLGLDPASRQRLVGAGKKQANNEFGALIHG